MAHAEPYCRCAPKGTRIVPCYRCETCGELRNDAADVHDLQAGDVVSGRVLVGGIDVEECRLRHLEPSIQMRAVFDPPIVPNGGTMRIEHVITTTEAEPRRSWWRRLFRKGA